MMKIIAGLGLVVVLAGAGYFIISNRTVEVAALPGTQTATLVDAASDATASAPSATPVVVPPSGVTVATPAPTDTNQPKIMSATLHTNKGDITIEFFPENAPNTVANFLKLASQGFYDGTKFHRVIKGFMDQGGDPLTKDDSLQARWGTGGPGYSFNDEISANNSNVAGSIAMANSGPNTQGSQFFINAVDNHNLDSGYTVFGHVTKGMDVVTAINTTPTDSSDRPLKPVILKSITLEQAQ